MKVFRAERSICARIRAEYFRSKGKDKDKLISLLDFFPLNVSNLRYKNVQSNVLRDE